MANYHHVARLQLARLPADDQLSGVQRRRHAVAFYLPDHKVLLTPF
jgi:hypothetical protein